MKQEQNQNIEIWIVEDDEELLELLTNYLVNENRVIKSFKRGKDALIEIEKAPLDILLTDLVMPDINGIDLLHAAKRYSPDSIVIIMTGYASLDSAISAIRGGAYDYIRKPFKLEELEIVINNASEKIYLKRENIRLLKKLENMMEDLKDLKQIWEERLKSVLESWQGISDKSKKRDIELILKQVYPIPPDYDIKIKDRKEKFREIFEHFIELKKRGFLSVDDFKSILNIFLEKLINHP